MDLPIYFRDPHFDASQSLSKSACREVLLQQSTPKDHNLPLYHLQHTPQLTDIVYYSQILVHLGKIPQELPPMLPFCNALNAHWRIEHEHDLILILQALTLLSPNDKSLNETLMSSKWWCANSYLIRDAFAKLIIRIWHDHSANSLLMNLEQQVREMPKTHPGWYTYCQIIIETAKAYLILPDTFLSPSLQCKDFSENIWLLHAIAHLRHFETCESMDRLSTYIDSLPCTLREQLDAHIPRSVPQLSQSTFAHDFTPPYFCYCELSSIPRSEFDCD